MEGTLAWRGPLVAVAVALALYANALGNPFLGDDLLAVVQNPTVARPSAAGLAALWTTDYWRGVDPAGRPTEMSTDRNLYRPVTVLSFWLNAWVAGVDAPAFRVVNVVLHALAAWLVGVLCRRWGAGRGALAAAAVVLLHPVATDVVNRIVGRADVLALAGIAGFLVVQRGGDRGGWTWARAAAAAVLAAVALGAKESGIVLVPLALLQAWLGGGAGGRPWGGLAALALALALYGAGRAVAVGVPAYPADPVWDLGGNPVWGADLAARLPVACALAWDYARAMVWPWPLLAFDVPPALPTWADPAAWAGALLLLGLGGATLVLARARHPASLGLAWWLASFLVVGQLVTPVGAYREVRFAYPMVGGFALVVGWLVARTAGRVGARTRRAATLVAAGLAAATAVGVVRRNGDFTDLRHLLEADVRQRPASPAALIRLANVHEQAGRPEEAERLLELVRVRAPRSAQAHYESADFYARRGRPDRARALHERAIALSPSHFLSLMALGNTALEAGDLDRAADLLGRAAAVAPDDPWVVYNLAVLDDRRGRRAQAIARLEALVARRPDFGLAVQGLARLKAAAGRR